MELPLHSSVAADISWTSPPKANADVDVPDPATIDLLAVDKSATSVQVPPFHSSVVATLQEFYQQMLKHPDY